MVRSVMSLLAVSAGIYFLLIPQAHAYLDPGTGAIILQMIIGGIAGASVLTKIYWDKIKNLFNKQKDGETPGP